MKHLIIMLLLGTTTAFGQIEKQLNTILLKKNFKELLHFVAQYDKEKDHVEIRKDNTRDIISGFQESMFYIRKNYGITGGGQGFINERLNVITFGNRIIYFYLQSRSIKNFPQNTTVTRDTIYKFYDSKKMLELKQQFQLIYKAPLNEKELFIDSIAVGNKCGYIPGRPTPYQERIHKLVDANDTASLRKCLQSANTETQIYGLKGFYYLHQSGINPSDEVKEMIRHIAQKKGTVYTCGICDHRISDIATAVQKYLF